MANSNTCAAYDSSLKPDELELIRADIEKNGAPRYEARLGRKRKYLDDVSSCYLEDKGTGPFCGFTCGADDKKKHHNAPRYRIDKKITAHLPPGPPDED